MKNIKKLFIISIFITLVGCTTTDEPETSASLFEAEILDTIPGNSFITEEYIDVAPIIERFISSGIPVSISTSTDKFSFVSSQTLTKNFSLTLYSTSAELKISTKGTEYVTGYDRKITTYTFTQGKYRITPTESGSNPYPMWIIIEPDCVCYAYEYAPDKFTEPMPLFDLDDYTSQRAEKISDDRVSTSQIEPSEYKGTFNAVTDPNGVVALRNDDYTYNFIPATGKLTQLEPDYKEIGELDRIK